LRGKTLRGFAPHSRGEGRMPLESFNVMYYVYILFSRKDYKFYVGSTSDLSRRIAEHKSRKVKSTRNRLPIALVCYEAYCYKSDALAREKFLKSSDGKKDLKRRLGRYSKKNSHF